MDDLLLEKLNLLTADGHKINTSNERDQWYRRASAFLRAALGAEQATTFDGLYVADAWERHALRLGHLEGLTALESAEKSEADQAALNNKPVPVAHAPLAAGSSRKVFVVHGHDEAAKESTARFLERLKLQPIILHEQANSGRTIIEKFEVFSDDIGFAVVLLTPDDVGGPKSNPSSLKARSRQNVILELGYFMGRLSRERVCALYSGAVELPSDIQGIIYIEMDAAGAWKAKLAQELVQAKLPIDLAGLLGG